MHVQQSRLRILCRGRREEEDDVKEGGQWSQSRLPQWGSLSWIMAGSQPLKLTQLTNIVALSLLGDTAYKPSWHERTAGE